MRLLNKKNWITAFFVVVIFIILVFSREDIGGKMNISYRKIYSKYLTYEEIYEIRDSLNIEYVDYNWKRELTLRNKTDMLVYHHTAIKEISAEEINELHKNNGWNGIGYHYYIRKDGAIYEGRPDEVEGAHVSGYNTRAIGISIEGNLDEEEITEEQLEMIKELSVYLLLKYDIDEIVGHNELGETSCPGINFPMDEIKEEVILRLKEK